MFSPSPFLLTYLVYGIVAVQILSVFWLLILSIRAWRYMGQQQKTLKQIHALLYKHIIAKP